MKAHTPALMGYGLGHLTLASLAAFGQGQVTTTWIELPSPKTPGIGEDLLSLAGPRDLGLLDVLIGVAGREQQRVYYATGGSEEDVNDLLSGQKVDEKIHPGTLRPFRLRVPLPDLSPWNDGPWITAPPSPDHVVEALVANWNAVFQTGQPPCDNPALPCAGKTVPLQGIHSVQGNLFVGVTTKWRYDAAAPLDERVLEVSWNGLARLDGTAPPSSSFPGATGELWSTGVQEEMAAVPEGVSSVVTGDGSRFLLVANYCGVQSAGKLLLQDITNLSSVDPSQRFEVDLYELLAQYVLGPPPAPAGPHGLEVDPCHFHQPSYPVLGRQGNKFRQLCTVWIPADSEVNSSNRGRLFLFATMNLDPIDPFDTGQTPYSCQAPADGGCGGTTHPQPCPCNFYQPKAADHVDVDDGRYDYLAVVDITDLTHLPVESIPPPTSLWYYQDPAQWAARTKFLRLPPDLPAGWTYDTATSPTAPPLIEGHDWSLVVVPHPHPSQAGVTQNERIIGSGTPSGITAHPDGKHLYVVTVDQGVYEWGGCNYFHDGGWHVPHLYAIDLTAGGSFADQTFLESMTASSAIASFRFPKLVMSKFPNMPDPLDPTQQLEVWGSKPIASTIPNWPSGTGTVYPGEYQLDPTAVAPLVALRNDDLLSDPVRLYVGANGFAQFDEDYPWNPHFWSLHPVGAVHVLSLSIPMQPSYLRTLTLPSYPPLQPAGELVYFRLGGFAALPHRAALLGSQVDRNVLLSLARDHATPHGSRLVLHQEN